MTAATPGQAAQALALLDEVLEDVTHVVDGNPDWIARADRDQLKKRMLDLAAAWEDEAADDLARVRPAPGSSTRAGVLNQCAGQICKGLDA